MYIYEDLKRAEIYRKFEKLLFCFTVSTRTYFSMEVFFIEMWAQHFESSNTWYAIKNEPHPTRATAAHPKLQNNKTKQQSYPVVHFVGPSLLSVFKCVQGHVWASAFFHCLACKTLVWSLAAVFDDAWQISVLNLCYIHNIEKLWDSRLELLDDCQRWEVQIFCYYILLKYLFSDNNFLHLTFSFFIIKTGSLL